MAILDARGRPVDPKALNRTVAAPTRTGVRKWTWDPVARGLTPAKLSAIFKNADAGDDREQLSMVSEIEEKDLHARAQLNTRRLGMTLPWKVNAADDSKPATDLAADVENVIVRRPGFKRLVREAMAAVSAGYSVLEITWSKGDRWRPDLVQWRDPRGFQVSLDDGETLRMRDENKPEGLDLPPYKFVVHAPALLAGPLVKRGLVRPLAVGYSIKSLGLSAWLGFTELFGIPWVVGEYPESATEDEVDELEEAIAVLAFDGKAVKPHGMKIEMLDAGVTGKGDAHERLCRWVDEQVSKLILGQTMTSDDGASLSQATIHNRIRGDIITSDGVDLAETLNRDLVRPYVDLNYGPQEVYPELVCLTDPPEDRQAWATTVSVLVDRGMPVEASIARDRLGIPNPAAGAVLLHPVGQAAPVGGDAPPAPATTQARASGRDGPISGATSIQRYADEAEADDGRDFVDDLVDEIGDAPIDPLATAVRDAASSSSSFSDFLARLAEREVDGDRLVKALASANLKARVAGDATDKVKL